MTKEALGIAHLGSVDKQVGDIDETNFSITATLTTAVEDRDSDFVDPAGWMALGIYALTDRRTAAWRQFSSVLDTRGG